MLLCSLGLEIAVSAALLVTAGLMVKSMSNFASMELEFNKAGVFTAAVTDGDGDFETPEQRAGFLDDLETEIGALAGVVAAGITSELPVVGGGQAPLEIEGMVYNDDRPRPVTRAVVASPSMFEVFEMRTLKGRPFDDSDDRSSVPVAAVNESFVARSGFRSCSEPPPCSRPQSRRGRRCVLIRSSPSNRTESAQRGQSCPAHRA